ncbi:MAG: cupin domain-containing protein [Eubacteriales bacterium]
MIKKLQDRTETVVEHLVNGEGSVKMSNIFSQEELAKTRICSVLTLEPGCSVGVHPHVGEGEIYLILEGSATVQEDGVDYILNEGDAEYCTDGHTHAIVNHTDKPMKFLAIVIL